MLIFLLLLWAGVQSPTAKSNLQQGLISLRDGKLADARKSFEAATQQDSQNAYAWASLAETCRRLGDTTSANNAAQKAEELATNLPPVDHALASFYLQEGQFQHAARLEEKYAESGKAEPQAWLRAAELYDRANDALSSERVLKTACQQHPTDPAIAFAYAQLLLKRLDFPAADKVVTPALTAHPQDSQLVLVNGVALYGERKFPEAIERFLHVIAIDPSIPQPYDFLGRMMEHAGAKLPEITEAFESRIKSTPDDALANLVLAKAKLAANSKDPSAEGLLRHSIAIDPKQWEAHYELGVLLEAHHDYKTAADELNQAASLNPKEPSPHYHLARVYDRLGDTEHAQAERKLHEELSNAQN